MFTSTVDRRSRSIGRPDQHSQAVRVIPPADTAGHQLIKEGNTYGY